MGRAGDRRGQSSVEYTLLLCMALTVTTLTGAFVKRYVPTLLGQLLDRVTDAVYDLASPY